MVLGFKHVVLVGSYEVAAKAIPMLIARVHRLSLAPWGWCYLYVIYEYSGERRKEAETDVLV